MTPRLLALLCDPVDKSEFELEDATYDARGHIAAGSLVSASGRRYPIRDGIPRLVEVGSTESEAVHSFGDEWNFFNFDLFRTNWVDYTVANTFGTPDVFRGRVVVDAGAGSGMQSRWMVEAGAEHVISLELSHAVDGVMKQNLAGLDNVDIVQCSIDMPPLRDEVISGLVICQNVIQHTRSVEQTARALWRIVAEGGEFIFNCYRRNDLGFLRRVRFHFYLGLRHFLASRSFRFRLNYARAMSVMRFTPILGFMLEKSGLMVRGVVPAGHGFVRRAYAAGVLNTFDLFGSHSYQHHKTDEEIRLLVQELQPEAAKVFNIDRYFSRPQPLGCALRLVK